MGKHGATEDAPPKEHVPIPHEYFLNPVVDKSEVERHATISVQRGEQVIVHYHPHGTDCRQPHGEHVGTGCKDWNIHLALLAEAEAKKKAVT